VVHDTGSTSDMRHEIKAEGGNLLCKRNNTAILCVLQLINDSDHS